MQRPTKTLLTPFLLAFMALGCAGASGADDELVPPDTVELTFDWPLDVSATFNKFGTTRRGPSSTSVDMTYTLRTEAVPEGWAVHFEDVRDVQIEGLTDDQRAMIEPIMKTIPSIRFKGPEVVGLVGYEPMVERLHEMMAPMYEQTPGLEDQMRSSMTVDMFVASARSEWAGRATVWNGRTMTVGKPVTQSSELTLVVLPTKATAVETLELMEVMPCPKVPERRCVRLRQRLEIPESDLRKAVEGPLGVTLEEAERYNEVEVVAEPDTLLTHELRKVEVVRVKAKGGMGVEQRKVSKELYEWNDAGVAPK